MARPICHSCGGICVDAATIVEVRAPMRPATAHTVCSDCGETLVRQLSGRGHVIPIDPPLRTVTRNRPA